MGIAADRSSRRSETVTTEEDAPGGDVGRRGRPGADDGRARAPVRLARLRLAAVSDARRSELAGMPWDKIVDGCLVIDQAVTIDRSHPVGDPARLRVAPTKTGSGAAWLSMRKRSSRSKWPAPKERCVAVGLRRGRASSEPRQDRLVVEAHPASWPTSTRNGGSMICGRARQRRAADRQTM